MVIFDLVFETYCKNIITDAFLPFENEFYYLSNFKPDFIDKEEDMEKYLVIFDEGELTRIHKDFVESGTKAYFLNFLTPVIQDNNSAKLFKEQLDVITEKMRFEDTEIQDEDGTPLFRVTSIISDSVPVEKTTQNGIRYLFSLSVSCIYHSLQEEEDKIIPVREEQRIIEISLDDGLTYKKVKGKLSFQKASSVDLNIFPTNNEKLAQHYTKQRRKTFTLQVQRATTGIAEELYQLSEDNDNKVLNVRIKVQDYKESPIREYLCCLDQVIENGEYTMFDSLVFTFEVNKLLSKVSD